MCLCLGIARALGAWQASHIIIGIVNLHAAIIAVVGNVLCTGSRVVSGVLRVDVVLQQAKQEQQCGT
jgi:hypothetical protein